MVIVLHLVKQSAKPLGFLLIMTCIQQIAEFWTCLLWTVYRGNMSWKQFASHLKVYPPRKTIKKTSCFFPKGLRCEGESKPFFSPKEKKTYVHAIQHTRAAPLLLSPPRLLATTKLCPHFSHPLLLCCRCKSQGWCRPYKIQNGLFGRESISLRLGCIGLGYNAIVVY